MKEFNKQLNEDVNKLKKLRIKKDKTDYHKFFTVVSRRHKISRTVLQSELRKPIPGKYRSITWDMRYRPITDEEVKMVYELLMQGYTLEHVKNIMEEKIGGNYSDSRMKKIRQEMEKRLFELEADNTTAFGGEIRKLFTDYCNLDLMEPKRTQRVKLFGKEYNANCGVIKEAINMIIYSAEGEGKSTQELQRIRMENMLSKKIDNMSASSKISMVELRSAEIVRKSQEKGQGSESLTPDGKVLVACCQELRPDLTYTDIFALAKKHINLIKGTTEEIMPDYRPASREALEIIRNDPYSGFASEETLKKEFGENYLTDINNEAEDD